MRTAVEQRAAAWWLWTSRGTAAPLRCGPTSLETANLVADTCGPADYVGYSLGGRVLLHLALARPDVVRRAVLIGVTAGIEDAARARGPRAI